jgi:hypothetical protein
MSIDIRNHLNLIKNHGYKGKIGMANELIKGLCLSASPGDIVLYKSYEVNEDDDEDRQEYCRTRCTIETPYSEEEIQENLSKGNGIMTYRTCVGVPIKMIDEIIFE